MRKFNVQFGLTKNNCVYRKVSASVNAADAIQAAMHAYNNVIEAGRMNMNDEYVLKVSTPQNKV